MDFMHRQRNKYEEEAAELAIRANRAEEMQRTAVKLNEELQWMKDPYSDFLANLSAPPDAVQVPGAPQLEQEHLSYKQRKQQKKNFDNLAKKHTLLSPGKMRELTQNKMFTNAEMRKSWESSKYKQSEVTNAESMRQIANGDYSNFENVQPTLKNVVASKELQEFRRKYPELVTEENYDVNVLVQSMKQEGGVRALMNPALRLGLSLARRTPYLTPTEKENYRRLDEAMSTELMVETLTHKTDANEYRQRLVRDCGVPAAEAAGVAGKEIKAAEAQKIEIAKRLLLMQLSNFKVYDKKGNASDWTAPVAVALSHCRRVALSMPVERREEHDQDEEEMWNAIFHSEKNAEAMDQRRAASTHSIKRRKINAQGPAKEVKIKTGNLIGQRGMNVAIGGIGNSGISGKMIRNNGSCGHFYSMYKESTRGSYGAILFGLESDAHGVVNQMGHRHNMKATAEAASSLGGQRADEIGADYGGRQCSLTHLTPKEITLMVKSLEEKMTSSWTDQKKEEMMRILAGKKLSERGIIDLRMELGVPSFRDVL